MGGLQGVLVHSWTGGYFENTASKLSSCEVQNLPLVQFSYASARTSLWSHMVFTYVCLLVDGMKIMLGRLTNAYKWQRHLISKQYDELRLRVDKALSFFYVLCFISMLLSGSLWSVILLCALCLVWFVMEVLLLLLSIYK